MLHRADPWELAFWLVVGLIPWVLILGAIWWANQPGPVARATRRIVDLLETDWIDTLRPAQQGWRLEVEPLLAKVPPHERWRVLAGAAELLMAQGVAVREEAEEEAMDERERDPDSDLSPLQERFAAQEETRVELVLTLARSAREEARDAPEARLAAARMLVAFGRAEEVRAWLPDSAAEGELGPAEMGGFGQLAATLGAHADAERLFRRALRAAPGDVEHAAGLGAALLRLQRPDEALEVLQPAHDEMVRRHGSIHRVWSEELHRVIATLLDEAMHRAGSGASVVEVQADAGMLVGRAGENYRLLAMHSLERVQHVGRTPLRLRVAGQEELRTGRKGQVAQLHQDQGLFQLRERNLPAAEAAFRRARERDPEPWAALLGLAATIEAHREPWIWRSGARDLVPVPGIEALVDPWTALTTDEQRLLRLVLGPVAAAIPLLLGAGGRLHVLSLDALGSDLPDLAPPGEEAHDTVDGLSRGPTCAVRIESLYEAKPSGLTVAHYLGHALYAILPAAIRAVIEDAWAHRCEADITADEYDLANPEEFFATGFERFVLREAFPEAPRDELHEDDLKSGRDDFYRGLARLIAAPAPSA